MLRSKYLLIDFDCYYKELGIFKEILYEFAKQNKNKNLIYQKDNTNIYEANIILFDNIDTTYSSIIIEIENKHERRIGKATFSISKSEIEYDFDNVFNKILKSKIRKDIENNLTIAIEKLTDTLTLIKNFNIE